MANKKSTTTDTCDEMCGISEDWLENSDVESGCVEYRPMIEIYEQNGCFFVTECDEFGFDEIDIIFWIEMKEKLLTLAFLDRAIQLVCLIKKTDRKYEPDFMDFHKANYISLADNDKQILKLTEINSANSELLNYIAHLESFELFLVEKTSIKKIKKMIRHFSNWNPKSDILNIELETVIELDNVFAWCKPREGKIEEMIEILEEMCGKYNYNIKLDYSLVHFISKNQNPPRIFDNDLKHNCFKKSLIRRQNRMEKETFDL